MSVIFCNNQAFQSLLFQRNRKVKLLSAKKASKKENKQEKKVMSCAKV